MTVPDKEGERARQAAYALLSGRDYSIGQMRDKLLGKEFTPAAVEAAIADLVRLNLLDDRAYARRWIERVLRGKPAGRRKISLDLRRKGISAEIIGAALEEFGELLDTEDAAADALRRQGWRYRGLERDRAKRRMFGYLARRGFDSELAARAVDTVWKEIVEDEIQTD